MEQRSGDSATEKTDLGREMDGTASEPKNNINNECSLGYVGMGMIPLTNHHSSDVTLSNPTTWVTKYIKVRQRGGAIT